MMKRLIFFQIEKAYCSILSLVSKKKVVWLLSLFLSVILALSSCERNGVILLEIQYQKPPTLTFNKLITSSRSLTESDLLKQIPEREKEGFTIKSIVIKDPYKAFAQVTGTKSIFSLNLKKEGTFTVKIVLEQNKYHDAVINDAEIELRIKKPAKVLTFDRLSTTYKGSLSKAEILGQVQGEKLGYTLKSIAFANTAFAQASGTAPNISLTLKKVGTFTATIVLEHLHYEDAAITGAAFEITKGTAKSLTFDKLITDKRTVTRAEILGQVQGEKLGYTLKSITVGNTAFAQAAGTAPDISLTLKKVGTFTATIVLEHPLYEDVTITGAEFEVIVKAVAKVLTFNRLSTTYKSRLSKAEILGQVQGVKSGYTLKSITVGNTAFAQAAGTAPNISLTLKKVGTFTATIVLEHPHYKDVTITGAAFEITKGAAKVLTFDRLRAAYKSRLSKAEILGQVQGEKLGYTLKSITVGNTAFAQAAGTAPNISLTLKKIGTFTATIVLEHPHYKDVTITGAAFEITKGAAKVLTFDRLRAAYKSRLSKAEILGQVQGEKLGYTLKSITVGNTAFAQAAGTVPNISLTLKKSGDFTATIVLEHPRYEDATIHSAAFEIAKEPAKNLTFNRLVTDRGTVTSAEILRQIQGEKTSYTLKRVFSITPIISATVRGTSPNLSLALDTNPNPFTFTATIVLESPFYEDATIAGAAFQKGENKYIFHPPSKTIMGIRAKYIVDFRTKMTVLTFPDQINGVDVERIMGNDAAVQNVFDDTTVGGNNIQEIHLPKNLKAIGERAFFAFDKLTSITIPNSVTIIEKSAFLMCSNLTSITIPDRVTTIGRGAFSMCSQLTSVTLSNTLTSIGRFAFHRCTNLTSITIPNSVTRIGVVAFNGCTKLVVTIEQTDPTKIRVAHTTFNSVLKIKVPAASLGAYQRAARWRAWAGKMEGY